jgi:hypothetical protein
MDEKTSERERLGVIEGTDDAALGIDADPAGAPAGAAVDPTETRVPGATKEGPAQGVKPWSTTLAFNDEQAGVGNDPIDEQEPQYPTRDDDAL